MNIYDIAGNVWEWTLECTDDLNKPCTDRGGCYINLGINNPASYRRAYNILANDDGMRISYCYILRKYKV